MTLGTRVAVMRDGAIEQLAPPLEIFRRPANIFVAGFIGAPAMNLIEGTLSRDGLGRRIESPAFAIADMRANDASAEVSDADDARGTEAPRGVRIGIRPHDIDLTSADAGHGTGRVEVVEPMGATTVVHLRVDRVPNQLLRVAVAPDASVGLDERVGFRINAERVHLFDERTGLRLARTPD